MYIELVFIFIGAFVMLTFITVFSYFCCTGNWEHKFAYTKVKLRGNMENALNRYCSMTLPSVSSISDLESGTLALNYDRSGMLALEDSRNRVLPLNDSRNIVHNSSMELRSLAHQHQSKNVNESNITTQLRDNIESTQKFAPDNLNRSLEVPLLSLHSRPSNPENVPVHSNPMNPPTPFRRS